MSKIYKFHNQKYATEEEYREALRKSDNRYKSYERWTDEEDKELTELSKTVRVPELADHFKRVEGGIRARLLKHYENALPKDRLIILNALRAEGLEHAPNTLSLSKGNRVSNSDTFLGAVLSGANPITGEILEEDSVWKHPKIISDIQQFLKDNND